MTATAISPLDENAQYALWQSMELALAQHKAGHLGVAQRMYSTILEFAPDHSDACHNLAVIMLDTGHPQQSLPLFQHALVLDPQNWSYWLGYFDALLQAGCGNDAIQMLEQKQRLGLTFTVLSDLVIHLVDALLVAEQRTNTPVEACTDIPSRDIARLDKWLTDGHFEEAISFATTLCGDFPKALSGWRTLGAALIIQGRVEESIAPLEAALKLAPLDLVTHSNLGHALQRLGQPVAAEVHLRMALRVSPRHMATLLNLGTALKSQKRIEEATEFFDLAIQTEPNCYQAHTYLAQIYQEQGRFLASNGVFEKAIQLISALTTQNRETHAYHAMAFEGLCVNYSKLADFSQVADLSNESMTYAKLALLADDKPLWERRLYALSYHPDLSAAEIFSEFEAWGDRFPAANTDFSAHDRTLNRRLKVGYVSPDFRRHTSRFFFWPFFSNHNPANVELFAYSNVEFEDDFTQQFKTVFGHWRDIRHVNDAELAAQIKADGIDILVDGCNHMRDDRLGVFALKPAPIQVTWLGAAWTTGLKAVDYVLFDPFIAPPETIATENVVRLPHCFVPFESMAVTDIPQPPPCLKNGYITFAYSGRSERLNHRTFRVWGEILKRLPTARLVLDFAIFADPEHAQYFQGFMTQHGVDVSRVEMRNSSNIFVGLHDFDILLDCFPHSGGTMLVDALWMGVPALTLAGRPPLGRIGTTFVMNLGLPDWVAISEDDYIDKACQHATDVPGLTKLRAGMRHRMQNSPLMDGKGFAKGVERAYATMWTRFCKGEPPSPLTVPVTGEFAK
jgi:protein O-GlcNAc transferase